MSRTIEDACAKAMGDQARELHMLTMTLLLGEMIRRIGVNSVRTLLLGVAEELEEFDQGPTTYLSKSRGAA